MPCHPLNFRVVVSAACLVLPVAIAHAQGALKPIEARIVNTPSNPVPVVGTVKLEGGVGAVTGTSGDKNVGVFDSLIDVFTPTFGNHNTPELDVVGFKEVRIMVSRSSCGPCGDIVAQVSVRSGVAGGFGHKIDEFPVGEPGGSFPFITKTYTVPGSKLMITLRATTAGTSNSVLVGVVGRAN
jgi:hypothetical protein